MKIHRRGYKVEDINITVAQDQTTGEDFLIFGGGHCYVRLNRPTPDSPELWALYHELEDAAGIYIFRAAITPAKARGPPAMCPGGHRRFCIRPFTLAGLGVFE